MNTDKIRRVEQAVEQDMLELLMSFDPASDLRITDARTIARFAGMYAKQRVNEHLKEQS